MSGRRASLVLVRRAYGPRVKRQDDPIKHSLLVALSRLGSEFIIVQCDGISVVALVHIPVLGFDGGAREGSYTADPETQALRARIPDATMWGRAAFFKSAHYEFSNPAMRNSPG